MTKLTREDVIKSISDGNKDFSGLDFSGLDLNGIKLIGANLEGANLKNVNPHCAESPILAMKKNIFDKFQPILG
jgi:uncharacterized protein YjbI with pentapeptide repeats